MSQKLQAQVYACQYCDCTLHNAFNLKEHEQRLQRERKDNENKRHFCVHIVKEYVIILTTLNSMQKHA